MKTNQIFHWMLTAAAVLGLSLGAASCSKDDGKIDDDTKETVDDRVKTEEGKTFVEEGNLTAEERYLIDCQSAIISILETLTGIDEVDSRFDQKTYEPVYGRVLDEAAPFVRSFKCDTPEEAEDEFRAIAGSESLLTETADGLSITLKDMPLLSDGTRLTLGVLTFHRGDGTGRTGYVEVEIPCIPHLERIDYITTAAFPENGSGNSAYFKGDIIYLPRGNTYCSGYYLCVQQADEGDGILVHLCPNEPGDDETINLDGDGDGCWYPYNNSKGQRTEFNDVKAYIGFILNNKDKVENIKMFLDGNAANKQPSQSGKLGHIFPEGFNNDRGVAFHSSDGRWAAIYMSAYFGDYAWVPAYDYRHSVYALVKQDCSSKTEVSYQDFEYVKDSKWNGQYDKNWNYTMNVIHFDTAPIHGATVEFSPTKEILISKDDASAVTQSHLGWCYADNNRLYENASKALAAGHTPLGIVAYVNDGSDFGNAVTEYASGAGRGLVISYTIGNSNTYYTVRWNPGSGGIVSPAEDSEFTQFVNKTTGTAAALTDFGGLEKTNYLSYAGSTAANNVLNHSPMAPGTTTGWFLPSAAQWIAMLCTPGLGGAPMPSASAAFPTYLESGSAKAFENIDKYINDGAVSRSRFYSSHRYWSSSAYSAGIGVYVAGDGGTRLTYWSSGQYAYARPVFAF